MKPLDEIPPWVIAYNNAGYQSGAGKAVKLLMDKVKSERNRVIDEAIDNLSQNPNEYISKEDTIRFLNSLKI